MAVRGESPGATSSHGSFMKLAGVQEGLKMKMHSVYVLLDYLC